MPDRVGVFRGPTLKDFAKKWAPQSATAVMACLLPHPTVSAIHAIPHPEKREARLLSCRSDSVPLAP